MPGRGCALWVFTLAVCLSVAAGGVANESPERSYQLHADAVPCAACHGDAAPAAPLARKPSCTPCHQSAAPHSRWRGSAHERAGLDCTSCHSIHAPAPPSPGTSAGLATRRHLLKRESEAETCFSCHAEVRQAMTQRSTHLFRDERRGSRVECSSCHDAHGGTARAMLAAPSVNDVCFSCHDDKRGPFLWEHAPVRENCASCHAPHGSNNTRLLVMRPPMLCQSCHVGDAHVSMQGHPRSAFETNRSCVNCHQLIHGSNHPSGVTLQR